MTPFLILILLHVIGDGFLQSREMAEKKSKELPWLIEHLTILSGVIVIPAILMLGIIPGCLFTVGNAILHGIIDWNIWGGYRWWVVRRYPMYHPDQQTQQFNCGITVPEFQYWKDSWFYKFIVTDQALHYATMYILYCLLI